MHSQDVYTYMRQLLSELCIIQFDNTDYLLLVLFCNYLLVDMYTCLSCI